MGIRTDGNEAYQLVGGKQYFLDEIQTEGKVLSFKKEIYTPAADETISANRSGAVVILADGIDIKLPTPEVGLNYRFITTGNIASTAATITSTSDGTTAANLFSGTLFLAGNAPVATTTQVDTLTFTTNAAEGEFIEVECLGATADGVAATATLSVADTDAADGTTNGQKCTIIDGNGLSRTYVISDTNAGGAATGTVLAADTDIGSDTAGNLGASVGDIAVGLDLSSATQGHVANAIKDAIEHANGHNGTITLGTDLNVASTGTNESITLTQTVTGTSGATVITNNISNVTFVDFQQADGKWWFRGLGVHASAISAT